MKQPIHRRTFAQACSLLAGSRLWLESAPAVALQPHSHQYRIAVCDWMILKRQKLGAIALTKEIGADGLELDMGSLGDRDTFDNALAQADVRQRFQEESEKQGIAFSSLAMSGFYAQSFPERPTYLHMVGDCITTMVQMSIKTAFLPLGVKGDLVQRPELRPAVIQRLKEVGKLAHDAGVVIGIETALDAKSEVELLEEIQSPAIRSYLNFANVLQHGRDLLQEIKILGKDRICQIHCTDEDGVLLEHNQRLNLTAVKQALDDLDWHGWLVIERSRDAQKPRDVKGNFGANTRYLKSIFG